MTSLLDLPEEVMVQHLFPQLRHNDLLRLRRVCKTTKDVANKYLWTAKKGHQGQWTLELKPKSDDHNQNLQNFLQMGLPPPSRLYINLSSERRKPTNFFEDPNLAEFISIYSKYVTHLYITRLEIPFMSTKEIRFYESLVKLEHLDCVEVETGEAASFQRKMKIRRSCLIPSTFQNLKVFNFDHDQNMNTSVLTFVRGLGCLEKIATCSDEEDYFLSDSVSFLLNLVEDPGCKLKFIDWKGFGDSVWDYDHLELLRLFSLCSDKGIKFIRLGAKCLETLLCNANGEVDHEMIMDQETRELVYRVDYQRNLFVGKVIHSLNGLSATVFLMELPYLEELHIESTHASRFCIWRRHGEPKWPNLKKIDVSVDWGTKETTDLVNFLCERVERPKLEELALRYNRAWYEENLKLPVPDPSGMVVSLGNLRKLTLVGCLENSPFFVKLWEGLPLLEYVELLGCRNLGNQGFIGHSRRMRNHFMDLKKLSHLSIGGIHDMLLFTDKVFRNVFCHMKLESLKLSGADSGRKPKVSVEGIQALLSGEFAESIEKLDFEELYLHGLSEDGRRELKSRFRSSQMF